jgi:hypothetical protein
MTFYFLDIKRGTRSYTPDFFVTENSGAVRIHEVKGYMDARSRVQLSRMAKRYPEYPIVLIQKKEMKELRDKLSALIPHWESWANDKLR